MERKQHWERIYASKKIEEFSWTQDTPATSISFLKGFEVPKTAPIIDIGGGDSKLRKKCRLLNNTFKGYICRNLVLYKNPNQ